MLNDYAFVRNLPSKQRHILKHHTDMMESEAASVIVLWDNEEETLQTTHEMGEWFLDYGIT